MGNQKARKIFISPGSVRAVDISETVSIPAGAAGTVVNFYIAKKPITDLHGSFIGGFGDTSLELSGGSTFATEVYFKKPDADLANGEYWVDYITGRCRGKKADTGTSISADYTIFTHN